VRLCNHTFWLLFKKSNCGIALFGRSFQTCNCAIALFFAPLKCANAQLLFLKEWMCENVQKMCKFPNQTFFALFSHFKKSNRTFSMCAIAQPWQGPIDSILAQCSLKQAGKHNGNTPKTTSLGLWPLTWLLAKQSTSFDIPTMICTLLLNGL